MEGRTKCCSAGRPQRRVALVAVLLWTSIALAGPPKLSHDLEGKQASDQMDVIIQFNQTPTAAHHQKVESKGGALKQELSTVKGAAYSVPASALTDLANDPDVAYISLDRPLKSHMNNAAPAVLANYAWGLGLDGTGIGVAVIDSGIHNVDDLSASHGPGRLVYSVDLIGGGPDDQYGHGTHVAGIIGGNGKQSLCSDCNVAIRGIAPNVNLISFRVLDQNGMGTDSAVIAAIQQAIQLQNKYNIRVMNLSLGRPVFESYKLDPVCQAVEKAWKAGIVVVVSAGNNGRDNSNGTYGYGTIEAPGNDPYVITVGAMNTKGTPERSDDVMTSYSSKGPTAIDAIVKPDLVAPGNRVVSLLSPPGSLPKNYPQNRPPKAYYDPKASSSQPSDQYFVLSGTSMATAVVSGAAALMLQQDPTLTPDQVKARLMKTAYKNLPLYTTVVDSGTTYNIQADGFTVGAGYLDLQAALSSTDRAPGAAKSPTAQYDTGTGSVYFLPDSTTPWGQANWGTSLVWGSNIFTSFQGNSAMWGSLAM